MKTIEVLAVSGSILAASAAAAQWQANGTRLYYMTGNVGVGIANPAYPLHVRTGTALRAIVGENLAATGATYGLWGQSASTTGRGVIGFATAAAGTTNGVFGRSDSVRGSGVFGLAKALTGETSGVYGEAASTQGTGVLGVGRTGVSGRGGWLGVRGESMLPDGVGVYGRSTATTGVFQTGVQGTAVGSGWGVRGDALATSGYARGVFGKTVSTTGIGVEGSAEASTGMNIGVQGWNQSTSGRGVYGVAVASAGTTYGVEGQTYSSSPGAYGVYSSGNMGASGTKSFRIDHPDDPANRYLLHYAAEAPEPQNFYNGVVTLDSAGTAWVTLPAYFARINRDPRYSLTAIGGPMPLLHIAAEIDERALAEGAAARPTQAAPICSFHIAGGAAGGRVSWRVEAIRNDAWVRARGAPVEIEKTAEERGTYQHPELYGQPMDKGLNDVPGLAARER